MDYYIISKPVENASFFLKVNCWNTEIPCLLCQCFEYIPFYQIQDTRIKWVYFPLTRKLPNVPITFNVMMKFLVYCQSVVNMYPCWLMFSIIYCNGYWYDMLNICEELRQVSIDWFCVVQTGYSPIRLGEIQKTMKGFYRQAENSWACKFFHTFH